MVKKKIIIMKRSERKELKRLHSKSSYDMSVDERRRYYKLLLKENKETRVITIIALVIVSGLLIFRIISAIIS